MIFEKRIRIKNINYYLGIELRYNERKTLTKMDSSYFDIGDLSKMIEFFEKESIECVYDKNIPYMNDIIYLYDRFPFIKYIKDVTYDNEGKIVESNCINKEEIMNYIKCNNIELNRWNKGNCPCPMLYQ